MLERLKPYAVWIYRAVVLVIIILLAAAWNSAHSAKADLSKELEREKIEKAGLLAEHESTKKQLKDREAELLMGQADLAVEIDRLKNTLAEKPKIIEVIQWRTKEVPVEVPVEVPGRDCPVAGADGKPAPKIVLIEGDTGHVEVSELTYETKAGNHIVVGKGFCVRDTPTRLQLFASVIDAPVSVANVAPDEEPYRWGAGIYASVTPQLDAVLGATLAFPPGHWMWLQWEPSLSLGFTTTGKVQPAAGIVARWK